MRSSTEPLRVLIVDDDPALLRTISDVLRLRGFVPAIAQSGQRAIEVAAATPPAVALVDLRLPDVDGLDLVTRLHTVNALTEVVVLTGNASVSSAVRALREHIFDYLLKPVAPDQLVSTLDRAGERWRRRSAEAALATTERRFRSLIENATDLITIIGERGIIEYASPAYQRAIGCEPELLLGTSVFDLVHAEDAEQLRQAISECASARHHGAPVTVRLRNGEGAWRTFVGTVRDLQLLAFSRRQLLQPQHLDLNQVVGDVERPLRRLIREDIELVTSLAPDLGYVYADLGQLEQILVNLVVNARDAQPNGGRIVIESSNVELGEHFTAARSTIAPGPAVMITISDDGCGMDEATMARMYEPFFTTKAGGRGSGLGLATVYGIVQQCGGHIWCYSEPGLGTTFKIYLPCSAEVFALPSEQASRDTASPGTETILLVEDEEHVRAVASRILRRNGYTVLEAGTGPEALQLWREHGSTVDLVLTDVVMPEMGGRELATRVRSDRPEMPLLFMSGYSEDGAF